MAGQRFLIVSAGMGAGHNQVARELARRWRERGDEAVVIDLLEALPWPAGRLLRGGYGSMLRRAPWLYDGVYALFLTPHRRWQPPITPLSWLIARTLRPRIDELRPTAVVSTIHIAGQGVGRLRARGVLECPSVVVITEAVPHPLWLATGTDLFCGMFPEVASIARGRTGADAIAPGPVISVPVPRPDAGFPPGPRGDALVVAGAWGVGARAGRGGAQYVARRPARGPVRPQ